MTGLITVHTTIIIALNMWYVIRNDLLFKKIKKTPKLEINFQINKIKMSKCYKSCKRLRTNLWSLNGCFKIEMVSLNLTTCTDVTDASLIV